MSAAVAEQVDLEVTIDARPETIFPFFTDAAKMTRWMGTFAELDPRPGGVVHVNVQGKYEAKGEFVTVEPFHRVVMTWGWEGEGNPLPPGSSTVEVTLTPAGEARTIVRLVHRDLPEVSRGDHAHGWTYYLGRLVVAAGGGDPGPDTPMM